MQLIDLCSGIGGFSLAAHWLGWKTTAFCEKDAFCQKVLKKNFPGVPIYDDVYTFPSESFRGRSDTILSAGFPCQPFSQAGKQLGRNDERHLFPKILEIVASIRPTWCVFENVRGLLGIESGHVFAEIITSLERESYEVITFCIPASALNAPHRRDRLWIVAHTKDERTRRESGAVCRENGRQDGRLLPELSDTDTSFATAHTLNGEHRANGRLQSEANSIQGISGAKGLSGRISGAVGDVADSTSERLERIVGSELSGQRVRFANGVGKSTDANESGLQGQSQRSEPRIRGRRERCDNDARNAEGTDGRPDNRFRANEFRGADSRWQDNWTDVAARTCVRGMDDGVPVELDIIGSRDNRVSRLKSLGNAIVPQIAYEIFRAIDEVEKKSAALGA